MTQVYRPTASRNGSFTLAANSYAELTSVIVGGSVGPFSVLVQNPARAPTTLWVSNNSSAYVEARFANGPTVPLTLSMTLKARWTGREWDLQYYRLILETATNRTALLNPLFDSTLCEVIGQQPGFSLQVNPDSIGKVKFIDIHNLSSFGLQIEFVGYFHLFAVPSHGTLRGFWNGHAWIPW